MPASIFIPDLVDENENGIFATNPIKATLPVIVAPTTTGIREKAHNTIRQEIVIVACANLKEYNFEFDSSVVVPKARAGFAALGALIKRHQGAPMSIFGHADPVGPIRYNHFLSERRARAIHAVLIKDPKIWDALFQNTEEATGDVWGARSLQTMLKALGQAPGESGKFDGPTQDAIRALLNLPPGLPVANTSKIRIEIFTRYMDFLRDGLDRVTLFPVLTDDDFLGKGKAKGTRQGCSKFNPQLLLTDTEQTEFDKDKELKDARDAANEPNRRVVIYFFAKGTVIDPQLWPCPASAALEGNGACVQRQWSNGDDRRKALFVASRRRFGREVRVERRQLKKRNPALEDTLGREETTFGCRFYHGVALHSPCERDLKMWALQVFIDGPTVSPPSGTAKSNAKVPLADRRFVAILGSNPDAPVVRGRTSQNGVLALPFFDPTIPIVLRIDAFASLAPPPAPPANPTASPTTDTDAFDDEDQFLELKLGGGALTPIRPRDKDSLAFDPDFDDAPVPLTPAARELAAMQRLYNLGLGSDDTGGPTFGNWEPKDRVAFLKQFQRDQGLSETGVVDDPTVDALFKAHGS